MWYDKVNTPGRFVLWLTITSDKEEGDILVAAQKRYTSENKQKTHKNYSIMVQFTAALTIKSCFPPVYLFQYLT